jgi:hypothetical protein
LDKLSQCGLEDYLVVFSIDYGTDHNSVAVADLCQSFRHEHKVIHKHKQKLGCDKNTYFAINSVFQNPDVDMCVYWEDDILASLGLCDVVDWYSGYCDRQNICLCLESYEEPQAQTNIVHVNKEFGSHGFICNRWQFETHLQSQWLDVRLTKKFRTPTGWDWNINNYVKYTDGISTLATISSYSKHIGVTGTYCNLEVYKKLKQDKIVLCEDRHSEFILVS